MKVKTRCILLALLGVIFSTQAYCNSRKSIECDWLSISNSAQKIIVQDYVNALDSFAMAMLIVGGDTESAWAADTVHTMTQRVKEGQRAFLVSMSDIYQMQNYIAYGMSYRINNQGDRNFDSCKTEQGQGAISDTRDR